MRDGYKKIGGKLYGIGIGPGDPELITLKAKRILDEAETIFVPKANEDDGSFARSIIEKVSLKHKNFIELIFPMTRNKKLLELYWQSSAKKIVKELARRKKVAFVTIGDPFIYSTYIYLLGALRKEFPEIKVETIPGISSFNAASCLSGTPLVSANEKLAILPVTKGLTGLREAIKLFDTVVLMKVGSKLHKVVCLLTELKLIKNSVLISHAGHSKELIVRDLSKLRDKKSGYLSVIIVNKNKKGSE